MSFLLELRKLAEYAPGIPEKGKVSPLPTVTKPEVWEFSAHPHTAARAGHHIDLRLGNPRSGVAHSFVVPEAKWPEPGKAVRVIPTQDHTIPYMDRHSFEIDDGYGKGTVHKGRRTQAEVHHSSPQEDHGTKLRFNLYDADHPQEYSIRKDEMGWWLHNKTLTRERRPEIPNFKPSYGERDIKGVDSSHTHEMLMPKLDGAHTVVHLEAGKVPRVFSYRQAKASSTGLIEHTHKVPGLMDQLVPKELDKTILRAETIAVTEDGRALPVERVGGMLNAKVWESRKAQEEAKAKLTVFPFNVVQYRGKDMTNAPWATKVEILRKVEQHLPTFTLPPMAISPGDKEHLLEQVQSGKHKLTGEGVVVVHKDEVPPSFHKAKIAPDYDVFIRAVHPAKAKGGTEHDRAGAVSYSWTPDGPVVGTFGGFKHEEARNMLKNPESYVGRAAKVRATKVFDKEGVPGALFQPRFVAWHPDKGDPMKTAMMNGFFDEMTKIASEGALGLANEVAGLGVLAVPSIQHLRGKPMNEDTAHKMEVAGLGMLAAPYAYTLAKKGLTALHR